MRIKVLFVFLCLGSTLTGCAQDYPELRNRLRLLQYPDQYNFVLDSTGFSSLNSPLFYSKSGHTDVFTIDGKNVHFVDFNNDGMRDIIYQGTPFRNATILFASSNKGFVEIWSGPGKLVHITQEAQTRIYVRTSAIGCFNITMLFALEVAPNNLVEAHTISCLQEIELTNLDTAFNDVKISGVLRTSPKIDDQEKVDICTGDIKKGNQLRALDNEQITIIKRKEEWLLAVLNKDNSNIIGWIKKENL